MKRMTSICLFFTLIALAPVSSPAYPQNKRSSSTVVVVGPTTGNPAASGEALLQALGKITTASATNPFLLKIEPGIYDLGANVLQMKAYVDVEGSGEGVTTITGSGSLIVMTDFGVELRSLTVKNVSALGDTDGVWLFQNSRMTNVTVLMAGSASTCVGVRLLGEDTTHSHSIYGVTIKVTNSGANNTGIGGLLDSIRQLDLFNVSIDVSGASQSNGGIDFFGQTLNMRNSNITVSMPGFGFTLFCNLARIEHSRIQGDIQANSTALVKIRWSQTPIDNCILNNIDGSKRCEYVSTDKQ